MFQKSLAKFAGDWFPPLFPLKKATYSIYGTESHRGRPIRFARRLSTPQVEFLFAQNFTDTRRESIATDTPHPQQLQNKISRRHREYPIPLNLQVRLVQHCPRRPTGRTSLRYLCTHLTIRFLVSEHLRLRYHGEQNEVSPTVYTIFLTI